LLDIRDPANPKRIDAVNDPNYAYWHSASFSNDGKKVVFTDEWGGGMGARCRPTDPNVWGADAIFHLSRQQTKICQLLQDAGRPRGHRELCCLITARSFRFPDATVVVQAWYQGGISVMDFTDADHPMEIAYFDRGPIDPKMLVLGGPWSAYWYNGHIYSSEIARGLDILDLTPTANLTQNEIDAAKLVRMTEFNVQNQQKIEWPRSLVVAKAYLDQLERSKGLSADQISSLRLGIAKASASHLGKKDVASLKKVVPSLEQAGAAKTGDDADRIKALAEILKAPVM
jgi:hypothetical protein